jgi:tetratricopeptide (TPR) repeat protein
MRAGFERRVAARDWKNAAIAASNLSDLQVTLGDLADAIAMAEQAVGHADRSGDDRRHIRSRTTLANAFHQAGHLGEARDLFEKAEAMQAAMDAQNPRLFSLRGYLCCDLLLRPAEPLAWAGTATVGQEAARQACNEARKRGEEFFAGRLADDPLLDIALDHLTLGRAHVGLWSLALGAGGAEEAEGVSHLADAGTHLDEAVAGLRAAGTSDHLPCGLFHRATLRRLAGDCGGARADLDEAFEIAEQGEMRLFLCDAHLGYAWLAIEEKNPAEARKRAGAARELIAATGYHRRDEELTALAQAISEYQA